MVASINEVRLIGHMGSTAEVRYTPDGTAVASFPLATSKRVKNKKTGEYEARTEWHRAVAWGKNAEFVGEYLGKGSYVYVEGELRTREWEKDGVKRYTTEVHGRVEPLEKRPTTDAPVGNPPADLPPPSADYDALDDQPYNG
ncbi:single-stranded DNA-binding protein [Pseudomonas aeruginosa]|uniref:single-stranded DNA-binding protein n=1 Tax=Pseudomonas aeruginosa TaxID=287 RepID=UPI003D9C8939